MPKAVSRRSIIGGAVVAALPFTARSYARIIGANDQIQIGEIGCGHRANGHLFGNCISISATQDNLIIRERLANLSFPSLRD